MLDLSNIQDRTTLRVDGTSFLPTCWGIPPNPKIKSQINSKIKSW